MALSPAGIDRWLNADDHRLAHYNCLDTLATARLVTALRDQLRRAGQLSFYEREVWPQIPAILALQARGIPFSEERRANLERRLTAELSFIDDMLRARYLATADLSELNAACTIQLLCWAGVLSFSATGATPKTVRRRPAPFTQGEWAKVGRRATLNPDSDAQLRRWLFEDLGLRPATTTESGAPSVNQDALSRIIAHLRKKDEPHRPILHDLMHRGRIAKILQDYIHPEVHDGRVYPRIKMLGTESGRLALSDPPVHSWPPELQGCIESSPGHVLLSADYRAIESRIFAFLTRDPIDLEIFEQNRLHPHDPQWDIHIRTACDMYGWTLDDFLAKPPAMQKGARGSAKGFRYGTIQYGGNPATVKLKAPCLCPRCIDLVPPTLDFSPAERIEQSRRWFARHPGAVHWRATVSNHVRTTHRLSNPMGQVRYFFQPWDSRSSPCALEREAWNWPIQSTATCILRRAMRRLHDLGAPIFIEWHDSLKLEVPWADSHYWIDTMRRVMEQPVPELDGMIFPVEIESGLTLTDMKLAA